MVGLPFANVGSVELQERMKYVEKLPGAGSDAAREMYEVGLAPVPRKGRHGVTGADWIRICA
jgi:hypothetical protein